MKELLAILIPILITICIGIIILAYDTILVISQIVAWLFAASLGLLIIAGLGYIYLLLRRMWRIEQEASLKVVTAPPGHQVYIHNIAKETTKAAHLYAGVYSNGRYETPSSEQVGFFQAYLEAIGKRKQQELPLLIEGQVAEKQRTIFNIVDTGVHFALFGPTDAGKTTLANHIIDYLQASKTLACDPHAKFNTWSSRCLMSQSYDDISHTIEQVFLEMSSRYDNGIAGDTILLAIDEWPAIIEERPDCERWIARISREGRKVGVRLLLLSQSDQIGEIGLSIALRNNFIKIELIPELTQQNQASIRHWDKSTELINLAGKYQRQMTIEEKIIDEWARVDKNDFDQAIKTVVSRVYSSDGGNQRQRVREVVSEHISSA